MDMPNDKAKDYRALVEVELIDGLFILEHIHYSLEVSINKLLTIPDIDTDLLQIIENELQLMHQEIIHLRSQIAKADSITS